MSRATGNIGESLAAAYLQAKGYRILARNSHQRVGELDLVALDPGTGELVFAEVKSRSAGSLGDPEESVSRAKMRKLIQSALFWMEKNSGGEERGWRIDVLSVRLGKGADDIEHFMNVTQETE